MNKDAVIATLRAHRADIERLGIVHVALFGSLARDEAGPDSDIDIAIDFADGARIDMFKYAGIKRQIAELFVDPVDVVSTAAMRDGISEAAKSEMIYAF
jgi:uncharacterized protein